MLTGPPGGGAKGGGGVLVPPLFRKKNSTPTTARPSTTTRATSGRIPSPVEDVDDDVDEVDAVEVMVEEFEGVVVPADEMELVDAVELDGIVEFDEEEADWNGAVFTALLPPPSQVRNS